MALKSKMIIFKRMVLILCLLTPPITAKTFSFEVVAIEYPPFTTLSKQSGGVAFELLKNTITTSSVSVEPLFLPPARAALYLRKNSWCGSFYPPKKSNDYKEIVLSEENVKLGLVRLKEQADFKWTSLEQLKGRTAAILRTSHDSEFSRQFTDAGIELAFAESPQAIVQMVLLSRVDLGLFDSWSFKNLDTENKGKLQLSSTSLLELPITIFVHNRCIKEYKTAAAVEN